MWLKLDNDTDVLPIDSIGCLVRATKGNGIALTFVPGVRFVDGQLVPLEGYGQIPTILPIDDE